MIELRTAFSIAASEPERAEAHVRDRRLAAPWLPVTQSIPAMTLAVEPLPAQSRTFTATNWTPLATP